VTTSGGPSMVWNRFEEIGQGTHLIGKNHHLGYSGRDGEIQGWTREQRPGIGPQRFHEDQLGGLVLDVAFPMTAEATGLADTGPVRRPIDRAVKTGRVDKGLQDQDGMAKVGYRVCRDPLFTEGEDPRAQIGHMPVRKDQEAGVVGEVFESIVLMPIGPADPLVAGLAFQGGDGEEEDGDGLVVDEGDVAEGGSCDVGLVEVVVLGEASVELLALVGLDEADDDAGEEVGFRRGLGGAHAPESWGRHLSFAQFKDDARQAGVQELIPDESALGGKGDSPIR